MNTRLLRKVKRHILEEPKRLDMGTWGESSRRSPCGTVGCIAGWGMVLSQKHPERFIGEENADALAELLGSWTEDPGASALGITTEQARRLFYVDQWPEHFRKGYGRLAKQKKAERVAERIEHFIKTRGAE